MKEDLQEILQTPLKSLLGRMMALKIENFTLLISGGDRLYNVVLVMEEVDGPESMN
jgi:hypothetical protein